MWIRGFLSFLLVASAAAVALAEELPFTRTEKREACADYDAKRRPFFGDLHVHTALSFDAAAQDTRNRPKDAYRFAKGQELGLQPYDAEGRAMRTSRIDRPLDFAAVTDHGEFLGEVHICLTPGAEGHDSLVCTIYRKWPRLGFILFGGDVLGVDDPKRFLFCGEDASTCLDAAVGPWREVQVAAEEAYDRSSDCSFTTFVAYEWTGAPETRNLHRNVVFRNDRVPGLPVGFIEAPYPSELWSQLDEKCADGVAGCEAIAIPHNSNISGGLMFLDHERDRPAFGPEYAKKRAEYEPILEIMQHKGESECETGVGTTDEQCGFEKLPYDRFGGRFDPRQVFQPTATNFVRTGLSKGLQLEQTLGTNPFKYGLIGSTDTHLGTPGAVAENTHKGGGGAGMVRADGKDVGLPDNIEFNPGGLAVLWAEENSRDSLFAAMQRREAYATSGPRMTVRFFGGWDYPADLCGGDIVDVGYAEGVPMGGDLAPSVSANGSPRFVVQALRDPGTKVSPSAPLQRIQIIKGSLEGGEVREQVFDVAGKAGVGSVDTATCEISGAGSDSLCTVWTDPDFDSRSSAYYYARVLEVPTCRWSTFICNAQGVDCSDPSTIPESGEGCCDARYPKEIQERAWTSPIWYRPSA